MQELLRVNFSFQGRIGVADYWLKYFLPLLALYIVFGVLAVATEELLILAPAYLIGLWAALAAATKRWHDRNKSGWMSLVVLIPLIGGIWFLVEVGFLSGTAGPNRFGPDPRAAKAVPAAA